MGVARNSVPYVPPLSPLLMPPLANVAGYISDVVASPHRLPQCRHIQDQARLRHLSAHLLQPGTHLSLGVDRQTCQQIVQHPPHQLLVVRLILEAEGERTTDANLNLVAPQTGLLTHRPTAGMELGRHSRPYGAS